MDAPARRRRTARYAVIALLLALSVGGATAGTWAGFTASTTNEGSFATGTLMLSNAVGTASACFSTAAGEAIDTNDRDCDALYPAAVRKPGDVATADVAVKNEGSLTGDLQAYVSACVDSDTAEPFHGAGEPCGALQVTIQEYTDATRTAVSHCRFGAATGAGITCAYGPTLDGLVASHGGFASGMPLETLSPGQTRWFRVALSLPLATDNNVQGRAAAFGLTWRMAQQ